jgi:tRNA threonylcarbamoyladenosine biosynthesis protein TsaB
MLLLVTDTSGKHGSVGLVRSGHAAGNEAIQLIESVPLAGGTFSAQLVPQIAGLLGKHGLGKENIDAFIVISGPGSFTGLRVGLAAIKAMAEILSKPIVPVSLLEVVAVAGNAEGNVLALLDAGRGEVYAGEYEVSRYAARVRNERLLPRSDFPSMAHGIVVSTPDAGLAELARVAGLTAQLVAADAETIARVGWRKLNVGETVSPEELEANYIRRSDAEIFAKPPCGT